MKQCKGRNMRPWHFSRNVYPSDGSQYPGSERPDNPFMEGGASRTDVGRSGAEATAQRYLFWVTPADVKLVQCANGRWHHTADRCDWGTMPYYDARVAHEVARRIRYRIPQRWEWIVMGGIAVAEAMRIALGDEGLLSLLGLR